MGAHEHTAESAGDLRTGSDQVLRVSSTTGRWSEYTQLSKQIKRAGLMDRRHGWYLARVAANSALLAVGGTVFLLLGDSWWQLLTAAYLAVVLTQIAFVGHDAGHRQIFRSRRPTTWSGWSTPTCWSE
jgi:fatty acid desaturase